MPKRKERSFKALYESTVMIEEPEITSVLSGSCCMQGPVDEKDYRYQTNTVSSRVDKGVSSHTKSQKIDLRAEDTGECNVCSAPCTSCVHIDQALMGSKSGESLGEISRENAISYSVSDAVLTVQSKAFEIGQHAVSETSNTIGVNSSLDSLCENAESKAKLKISDVPGASQDASSGGYIREDPHASIPHKTPDQGNLKNKSEEVRGLEGHDDNISCVSGANDAIKLSSSDIGTIESKNIETSGDVKASNVGLAGLNSEISMEDCPKIEAEGDHITHDLPTEALNSVEQKQEGEKVKGETSIQSHPLNESDESDILSHDVNVCDICGDAGREDLLAVCCRCIDGAEHTYCMRKALDKVPEGDWLCEECELEERKNQEKNKLGAVDGVGKNQFSGLVGLGNADRGKSDGKDADVKGNKTDKESSSVKISRKRNADEAEVSSVAKKQALDPTIRSPKVSGTNRVGILSRDGSYKKLDMGKVKPVIDTKEAASPGNRLQTSRGTFLKSNSFSAANAKPKVRLLDEVVLKKQRSIREPASLYTKEGSSRVMDKSLSFKSVTSGRLSSGESKLKMLSPKSSHVLDLKGLKHAKEGNSIERKSSFKSERTSVSSTIPSSTISSPRVDKTVAARGETVSFSSTSNNRDSKAVPSDSKPNQLKPVNHDIHTGSELPVPLGKKQLSSSATGVGDCADQKSIKARVKDNSLSDSLTGNELTGKISESLPDRLPQARESTNVAEKVKESSTSRPRQSTTAGEKIVPCQKCKDLGHCAEFCTVDSHQSKVAMDKGNKLKAAIEAAMLKKPGIYRKRVPDQSNEVSVSSINSESPSQDKLSNLSNPRKLVADEEVNEALKTGIHRPILPINGKPSMTELATSAIFMSAIPELEYIWQGSFEVHRNGKLSDIYDGFQAHLSSHVSGRVVETMNKFPCKVVLNEVPRVSSWPMQFKNGAKEDHIALYFFARDHESYEKSYKIILENMMRNDLALKGNIDGVEILIFPSNQLPLNSQRWNMMFFLWGVFRGNRDNSCLQQLPASPNKHSSPRDMPRAIMSLPENICSLVPIDNGVATGEKAADVAGNAARSLIDLPTLSSTEAMNGDNDTFQKGKRGKWTLEPEYGVDCNLLPATQSSSLQSRPEIRSMSTSLEGHVDPDYKVNVELQASAQVTRSASDSNTSVEKMPNHSDTPPNRRTSPRYLSRISDGVPGLPSLQSVGEENIVNIPDQRGTIKDQLKLRNSEIEGELEATGVPIPEKNNSWNQGKRSYPDSTVLKSEAASAGSSQSLLRNKPNSMLVDGGSASKKRRIDYNDIYRSSDGSPTQGVAEEGFTVNPERHFFPRNPVKNVGSVDSSIPWKSIEEEEPLEERVPNLELALGADTKPPLKPSLPPFLAAKVEQNQSPGRAAIKLVDDDISAALSLSLSFPFPHTDQPVTKTEQLHANNPTSLFGGFPDK